MDRAVEELARSRSQGTNPLAVVELDSLISEYRENEFAAEQKYGAPTLDSCHVAESLRDVCRFIETRAAVEDFGRDVSGQAVVNLVSKGGAHVQARFLKGDQQELAAIHRGDDLTLWCEPLYDRIRYGSTGLLLTACSLAGHRNGVDVP